MTGGLRAGYYAGVPKPARKIDLQYMHRFKRAIELVWHSAPGWTLAVGALSLLQGVLPLAALFLLKLIVDTVSDGVRDADPDMLGRVGLLIAAAAGVSLITTLCSFLSKLMSEAQSQTVTDYVYDVLHAKSIEIDLAYYESSQYYDTLHLAQEQAPYRPVSIVNSLTHLAQSSILLVAISGLLFSFHWGIALILFAAAVPGFLVRFRYARTMYRWERQHAPAERLASYFNWMLTGDAYAKEVRLFQLGRVFMQRFSDLRSKLRRGRLRLVAGRSAKEFATQACATVAIFGSLLLVAVRTAQGQSSLGEMVMLFMAFQRGHTALRELLASVAVLHENNLFISNFYEFLDLAPTVADPPQPKPVPVPMRQGIVFDHVLFKYPGTTRSVIEDISLAIRPGEHVALVGENGAGKTTLIKLLCRLYDPDGGSITVDGVNLRELVAAAWRRQISVIFQDFAKYQLSARENIWLGNVDLAADSPQVLEAAKLSGADEVIGQLPHGYETRLGRWFEEGEELSIGQWQEIALARAFLRNAGILILDEPTSALDARAEYEVFQRLHRLAKGKTAIIISHRMSTVRMADRIVVLDGGCIVENGSHEELVRADGLYATLFEMQAQNYR